jgi:Protein of unknown function (DUF1292)
VAKSDRSEDEITLLDESGQPQQFRLCDVVDLEGATYYVVESCRDDEQVLVLRERQGTLESVHGAELERVLAVLDEAED